jgi:hypothetical protein
LAACTVSISFERLADCANGLLTVKKGMDELTVGDVEEILGSKVKGRVLNAMMDMGIGKEVIEEVGQVNPRHRIVKGDREEELIPWLKELRESAEELRKMVMESAPIREDAGMAAAALLRCAIEQLRNPAVKVRPVAPGDPRPTSPYLAFAKERRPDVRKENPAMSFKDISVTLGKMWTALDVAGRRPYIDQSKADWAAYFLRHPERQTARKASGRGRRRGKGKPNFKRDLTKDLKRVESSRWQPQTVKQHEGAQRQWEETCAREFGVPAWPIQIDHLNEYIVRLMAVDDNDEDFAPRKGSTIRNFISGLRAHEELHPELGQMLESQTWRRMWKNIRSVRGFRSNPFAKKPFPLELANALFLKARDADQELYLYMAVLRASWMRGNEAANLRRSDITVIYGGKPGERLVHEVVFKLRDSKTDIQGAGVAQLVKLDLGSHVGDVRELLPRLEGLDQEDFVFPYSANVYRRRMRSLLKEIVEESPALIPGEKLDVEDYGLHSWRKLGATIAAAGGVNDYEIMQYGRWKSLEFTKYARVSQHDAAEHVRLALANKLQVG